MKRRSLIKSLAMSSFLTKQMDIGSGGIDLLQRNSSVKTNTISSAIPSKDIYKNLGVTSVINGRGTVTIIGATRVLPEVTDAMESAKLQYVQLDELMDAVSVRLAELTGTESGIITTGATGALTVAAAGIVTGGNPDKLWQLPHLDGMKDEVIIPVYSWTAYESAVRGVGVKMIEVTDLNQLENAISDKTAMVVVLAGDQSETGPLSLQKIAQLTKCRQIPIVVDAAAEGLELPNPHISQGADLVAYSGGKYLNGPQCTGLLLGKRDLVRAAWICSAPHHGWGRGYKVGREEIIGMLTAVEMWWKRDHFRERQIWKSRLVNIENKLKGITGVKTYIKQPIGRSNPSPDLYVTWDKSVIPYTGYDVENLLWNDSPRVAVSGAGSFLPFPPNMNPDITINSSQLNDGEELIIAERVYNILAKPIETKVAATPGVNVSGDWILNIRFVASAETQKLHLVQSGSNIYGIHYGSYAPRKLVGEISGRSILFRSSYTQRGVRLNYEFLGNVLPGGGMQGTVSMGEYGKAEWMAKKQ